MENMFEARTLMNPVVTEIKTSNKNIQALENARITKYN